MPFAPVDIDRRQWHEVRQMDRQGHGRLRLRLLRAYDGKCAVTHEHTEPTVEELQEDLSAGLKIDAADG